MINYVNKIGLGTVQFGLDYGISNDSGITSSVEIHNILEYARDNKIELVDTAFSYGTSEECLGEHNLEKLKIVSKFPRIEGGSIKIFFEQSISRMKISNLYGYLAHSGQNLINNPSLWNDLVELKESGKVEKIGYSLYKPKELEQLLALGMKPDLIQIPFNILDNRFEQFFGELKGMGTEIHTRSCFLQGLFFLDPKELNPFFNPAKRFLIEFHEKIKSVDDKISYLINYAASFEAVDKVILGVNNVSQLNQNFTSLSERVNHFNLELTDKIPEDILLPSKWPVK